MRHTFSTVVDFHRHAERTATTMVRMSCVAGRAESRGFGRSDVQVKETASTTGRRSERESDGNRLRFKYRLSEWRLTRLSTSSEEEHSASLLQIDRRDHVFSRRSRLADMQILLMEDHELHQLAISADPCGQDAVAVLVERLGGFVVSFVCSCCTLQHDDLQDVVQQVWIRIFRRDSSEEFQTAAEFRGWVKTVARSRAIDFVRRRRHSELPENFEPEQISTTEDARVEFLQKCLDELRASKPQFAEVVVAVTAGKSGDLISSELGISRNTVYTRFDRAKTELKACVERRRQ